MTSVRRPVVIAVAALAVVATLLPGSAASADSTPVQSVPNGWVLVGTSTGLRAVDPTGSAPDGQLFGPADPVASVAFSPTRDTIVASYATNPPRTLALAVDGTVKDELPNGATEADTDLSVSPDGKRLLARRPDTDSLVITDLADHTESSLPSSADLLSPAWAHDGHTLAAVTADGGGVVQLDVATGSRRVYTNTVGAVRVAVSRTGVMAFLRPGQTGMQLWESILTTGPLPGPSRTFLLDERPGLVGLGFNSTGQFIAAITAEGPTGQTYVYDSYPKPSTPLHSRPLGASSLAWFDIRSQAPSVSFSVPAVTQARVWLIDIRPLDPDDALGGLRLECRVDGQGSWFPCASGQQVLTGLAQGDHTVSLQVTDPTGLQSVASQTWTVDTTGPTAGITSIAPVGTASQLSLGWTGSDTGGSFVSSYDVRERFAPPTGSLGDHLYPLNWAVLGSTSLTAAWAPGYEYCLSVRGMDFVGNLGPWSAERCTAAPLDDAALTATSGWTRGRSTTYQSGTYSLASTAGVSLSKASVKGLRIGIVATTCSTCGSVDVYHAGVLLGRVSLKSSTTAYRQLKLLPLGVTRTGSVVIKTVNSGPVAIDGLVVLH